nr:MAG TPA: hypothetical protein [Caudoviricetes sp.]
MIPLIYFLLPSASVVTSTFSAVPPNSGHSYKLAISTYALSFL